MLYQNRDHGYPAIQCRFNLDPHEITGIIQSVASGVIGLQPFVSDDDEYDVAGRDDAIDVIAEIDAVRNGINIEKYRALTEA